MYHIVRNFGGKKVWRKCITRIIGEKALANPTNLTIRFNAHLICYLVTTCWNVHEALIMSIMTYSFVVESMIWGYHEYKHIWENPSEDDELIYECEIGNAHDTHAVALRKNINRETRTVGHIPRKISSLCCSIFIRGKWTSTLSVWPTTRGVRSTQLVFQSKVFKLVLVWCKIPWTRHSATTGWLNVNLRYLLICGLNCPWWHFNTKWSSGLGRIISFSLSSFLSSFCNDLKYFSIDIFTCTMWPKLTHVIIQVNGEKTLANFMQFTKCAKVFYRQSFVLITLQVTLTIICGI